MNKPPCQMCGSTDYPRATSCPLCQAEEDEPDTTVESDFWAEATREMEEILNEYHE